jgi:hypothetical protein
LIAIALPLRLALVEVVEVVRQPAAKGLLVAPVQPVGIFGSVVEDHTGIDPRWPRRPEGPGEPDQYFELSQHAE